jgi:hypothetical protein
MLHMVLDTRSTGDGSTLIYFVIDKPCSDVSRIE